MIKVAVCGAAGRMGRLIIKQVTQQKDMKLVAAIDEPHIPEGLKDAGELSGLGILGVKVTGAQKLKKVLKNTKADVLVDFTTTEAAVRNIKTAAEAGVDLVVGTTGFTSEQLDQIEKTIKRKKIRAVISPNMSVGVNVFFKSVEKTAGLLGKNYDVEIVETHHVRKKDAPSGTAKRAAQIIAKKLGKDEGDIKIKSIREGEVVGEHTVKFSRPEEHVEITHRAISRETFAVGAVKAIRYVVKKGKPGTIQNMQDVLGLG
jgi:4-hydroxy-tetrahydrodipicolinate reductase